MSNGFYISLDKKFFDENKKDLLSEENDVNPDYYITNLDVVNGKQVWFTPDFDGFEFDEDTESLTLCGSFSLEGKDVGNVSITCKLSIDLMAKIVSHYAKKLNKLKTVLEAVK